MRSFTINDLRMSLQINDIKLSFRMSGLRIELNALSKPLRRFGALLRHPSRLSPVTTKDRAELRPADKLRDELPATVAAYTGWLDGMEILVTARATARAIDLMGNFCLEALPALLTSNKIVSPQRLVSFLAELLGAMARFLPALRVMAPVT